jgi:hypothetical protein
MQGKEHTIPELKLLSQNRGDEVITAKKKLFL